MSAADFVDPQLAGNKLPAKLRPDRDMVRTGRNRYELVRRVRVRGDGWVVIGTDHGTTATPGCLPVAWMDKGHARDLKLAAIERFMGEGAA